METFDYKFKISVIGDSMTGKTALLNRFINNSYFNTNNITIGTDFKSKIIELDGKKIKLMIWDTAGQERFADIVKVFYINSDAIIITFDTTNIESFNNLKKWIMQVKENTNNPYVIIVGTKYDIEEYKIIQKINIELFLEEFQYDYIEVSAKTNFNINNLFEIIISNIIKIKNKEAEEKNKIINNNNLYYQSFQSMKNYIYNPYFYYCSIM